jgi:hypothetical protein
MTIVEIIYKATDSDTIHQLNFVDGAEQVWMENYAAEISSGEIEILEILEEEIDTD